MANQKKGQQEAPVVEPEDLQPEARTVEPEGRGSVTLRTRGLCGEYRHGIEGVPVVTSRPRNFSIEDSKKILTQPGAGRYVTEVKN